MLEANDTHKRRSLVSMYGLFCQYCGDPVENGKFTADHMTPKKKGGSSHRENLTVACHRCNTGKGNRTVEEWRSDQEKLMFRYLEEIKRKLPRWCASSPLPVEDRKALTQVIEASVFALNTALKRVGVCFPLDKKLAAQKEAL